VDLTHAADLLTCSSTATTLTITVASAITPGDVIQFSAGSDLFGCQKMRYFHGFQSWGARRTANVLPTFLNLK
jgi:hypothetical protein